MRTPYLLAKIAGVLGYSALVAASKGKDSNSTTTMPTVDLGYTVQQATFNVRYQILIRRNMASFLHITTKL